MDKESLIKLTNNLYKLSLLFPKKEPLRYKIHELADEILAGFLKIKSSEAHKNKSSDIENNKAAENNSLSNLEILDCFFDLAKEQNWVKTEDILALQKEYANLREELERLKTGNSLKEATLPLIQVAPAAATITIPEQILSAESNNNGGISERQEKILTFLREQGRAQVWQIKQILPEVTKRTLRRDFEDLLRKGIIERIGERNETFYQIKISQA